MPVSVGVSQPSTFCVKLCSRIQFMGLLRWFTGPNKTCQAQEESQ
jgi:hypothetical protein